MSPACYKQDKTFWELFRFGRENLYAKIVMWTNINTDKWKWQDAVEVIKANPGF